MNDSKGTSTSDGKTFGQYKFLGYNLEVFEYLDIS